MCTILLSFTPSLPPLPSLPFPLLPFPSLFSLPLPSLPLPFPPFPPLPSSLPSLLPLTTDNSDYEGFSVYDIADMIKLYFRELPEPLLTAKFSEILIVIHESECVHTVLVSFPNQYWNQTKHFIVSI